MNVPIKGFLEHTLIDWPGRIAAEVFLPRCNFRCPFCHAGHLVVKPNELESIPFESITEYLERQREWIDGVVISGGEPTLWDELPELVATFGRLGFAVKIDTNGTRPEMLEALFGTGIVEAVSMDVKAPLDERYDKLAGVEVDLEAIRRSIDLMRSGRVAQVEFRTTVPPGWLEDDDIIDIAASLEGADVYVLQAFRSGECLDPRMNDLPSAVPERLQPIAQRCGAYVKQCFVRGLQQVPTGFAGG